MVTTSEHVRVVAPESARALVAIPNLPAPIALALQKNAIEIVSTALDLAFEQVGTARCDLLVLDGSPEALRVCRLVKSHAGTHFLPVLVFCRGEEDLLRRAYLEGADHVLCESDDTEALVARAWSLVRTFHIHKTLEMGRRDLKIRRDWLRYLVHDVGNALAKVVYNIVYLRRRLQKTDAGALEPLMDLEHAINRSVAMLRDFFDVDRLRRSQLPLHVECIDITQLAASVMHQLGRFAEEHDVKIVLEAAPLNALGDRTLVERVLTNLSENAIRHSPRGKEVFVRIVLAEGAARVSVENHGPSIPVERRSLLFQPFVRFEEDSTHEGAGLGLAFARVAIEVLGGRIWIDDPPEGGVAFVFTLPIG